MLVPSGKIHEANFKHLFRIQYVLKRTQYYHKRLWKTFLKRHILRMFCWMRSLLHCVHVPTSALLVIMIYCHAAKYILHTKTWFISALVRLMWSSQVQESQCLGEKRNFKSNSWLHNFKMNSDTLSVCDLCPVVNSLSMCNLFLRQ